MFWSINIGQVLIFIGLCVVGFGLFAIADAIGEAFNSGIKNMGTLADSALYRGERIADKAIMHGHQIADQLRQPRVPGVY